MAVNGRAAVTATDVLFIGVSPIWDPGDHEIRVFARRVLAAVAKPGAKSLAVTLHGVNIDSNDAVAGNNIYGQMIDAIAVRS